MLRNAVGTVLPRAAACLRASAPAVTRGIVAQAPRGWFHASPA
eukprot:CAMPEP_0182885652 /NCGR_PEP_ID=MMETSP0034_2-20130328/19743_1 /TAXON_ID=156128 /ORGANISM="Nephroselmis pyriformis, Strain CCMP717" /LENGTH=42 /DNA_ID= /DNA_START= /DNA_END= /DNA_ORIENTATION=